VLLAQLSRHRGGAVPPPSACAARADSRGDAKWKLEKEPKKSETRTPLDTTKHQTGRASEKQYGRQWRAQAQELAAARPAPARCSGSGTVPAVPRSAPPAAASPAAPRTPSQCSTLAVRTRLICHCCLQRMRAHSDSEATPLAAALCWPLPAACGFVTL